MRKNHNKLYYGKFKHKTILKVPGSLMFYPTTNEHLLQVKKNYKDAPDMIFLSDFIMNNRKILNLDFKAEKQYSTPNNLWHKN